MSTPVILPPWMGAMKALVNVALGIPPTIPFTGTEAILNPRICMQQVTEEQCEHVSL